MARNLALPRRLSTPRLLVVLALANSACFAPNRFPEEDEDAMQDASSTGTSTPADSASNTDATAAGEAETTSVGSESGDTTSSGGDWSDTDLASTGQEDDTEVSSSTTGAPGRCGDGEVEAGEFCDDGSSNGEYGHCAADCQGDGPACGDGHIDRGFEQCDDGDTIDGNGCNIDCALSGSTLWELTNTTAGPDSDDMALDIVALQDGTIRLIRSSEPTSNDQSIVLIDYDLDGNELGQTVYPDDQPGDIRAQAEPDGSYFLLPHQYNTGPLRSFNAAHAEAWVSELSSFGYVARRSNGGAVMSWSGVQSGTTMYRLFVLGPDGDIEYEHVPSPHIFQGHIAVADDQSFVVTSHGTAAGTYQRMLTRYAADGTILWQTNSPLPPDVGDNWAHSSLTVSPEGRIAVSGSTTNALNNEVFVSVFESDGSHAWNAFYAHDGLDDASHVYDIAFDSSGSVIVAGDVVSGPDGLATSDALVLKYSAEGEQQWSQTFDGDAKYANDRAYAVDTLEDGSIIIAGELENVQGNADAWLVRLAP